MNGCPQEHKFLSVGATDADVCLSLGLGLGLQHLSLSEMATSSERAEQINPSA